MKKIFITIIFIFSISFVSAQMDRRIGPGQYKNDKQGKKVDVVETSVETLKEKLKLDGFQEAIVRNLIKDNQAKAKEIFEALSLTDIEKRSLLTEISEKFNVEIKKTLSDEQYEKYQKLISKNKK